jgi:hypothetical protein
MLGQQVPGFSGGLPSQGGLSVLGNPMADELQSQYAEGGAVRQAENVRQMGRGEDSVLMHVTPHELSGLQALAMAHGGSLTINPQTGLPEAGFLGSVFKKLLPTLVGAGLMFIPGVNAVAAAGIVGGGSTLLTGSLKKGLMAGLSAYGGASLARGLGAGVQAAKSAAPLATSGGMGANAGISAAENAFLTQAGGTAVPAVGSSTVGGIASAAPSITGAEQAFLTKMGGTAVPQAAKTGLAAIPGNFAKAAQAGLPKGIISKAAPMLAGSGLMQGVSGALSQTGGSMTPDGRINNSYQGPYYAEDRQQIMDPEGEVTGKQRRHFARSMPAVYNTAGQMVQPGSMTERGTPILQSFVNPKAKKGEPMYDYRMVPFMGGPEPTYEQQMGYAKGGKIEMEDGAFVLDARTVSEIGNGSSSAGIEILRRLGGRSVKGRGDGVSDSVPARIGKRQPARVARDEVIIPAEAVRKIGKGNPKRGAAKLYALMDKAHKARKNAKRGQDTKLRRGLAL